MTKVSFPNQNEYSFQYQEQPSASSTEPTIISSILESCNKWDGVTLYAKAIHTNLRTVVNNTNLQVAEAVFADNTGIIKVDLWEQNISKAEVGKVYQISPVLVRVWCDAKKLSTIISSVVTPIPDDQSLHEVQVAREEIELMSGTTVINVPNIQLVEKVETFVQCVKCSKKIIEETAKRVVTCDR